MKKILALTSAAVMALSMSACGGKDLSDSPYAGNWEATGYEMWGFEMDAEEMGETYVTLNGDGKAEMVLMDESAKVKWEETQSGIELSGGGVKIEGHMDGDTLVLTYSDISIYLQKN